MIESIKPRENILGRLHVPEVKLGKKSKATLALLGTAALIAPRVFGNDLPEKVPAPAIVNQEAMDQPTLSQFAEQQLEAQGIEDPSTQTINKATDMIVESNPDTITNSGSSAAAEQGELLNVPDMSSAAENE